MPDPHESTSRAPRGADAGASDATLDPSASSEAAARDQGDASIERSDMSIERSDASIARMRALLDRPLTAEDLRANTALVAAKVDDESGALRSILVFRVGVERLALDATSAHRVVLRTGVRRIPHRTNEVLAGVASVGGELTLVARIEAALGIAAASTRALPAASGALAQAAPVAAHPDDAAGAPGRFVVIGDAASRWAFAVDHVEGVRRVPESLLLPPPATVRHAADGCTAHLVPVDSDAVAGDAAPLVSLLDARRLAALFARSLA